MGPHLWNPSHLYCFERKFHREKNRQANFFFTFHVALMVGWIRVLVFFFLACALFQISCQGNPGVGRGGKKENKKKNRLGWLSYRALSIRKDISPLGHWVFLSGVSAFKSKLLALKSLRGYLISKFATSPIQPSRIISDWKIGHSHKERKEQLKDALPPIPSSVTRRAAGLAALIWYPPHNILLPNFLRVTVSSWGMYRLTKSALRPLARVMAESGCNNIRSEPSFPRSHSPSIGISSFLFRNLSPLLAWEEGKIRFFPNGNVQFWKKAGGGCCLAYMQPVCLITDTKKKKPRL